MPGSHGMRPGSRRGTNSTEIVTRSMTENIGGEVMPMPQALFFFRYMEEMKCLAAG